MCELWWTELTTGDVSASPEVVICQIHAKEMICISDGGPDIYIRCGGQSRQLCVEIKMMFLMGGVLRTCMSSGRQV